MHPEGTFRWQRDNFTDVTMASRALIRSFGVSLFKFGHTSSVSVSLPFLSSALKHRTLSVSPSANFFAPSTSPSYSLWGKRNTWLLLNCRAPLYKQVHGNATHNVVVYWDRLCSAGQIFFPGTPHTCLPCPIIPLTAQHEDCAAALWVKALHFPL